MAAYQTILVDRPEDGIAVLTLNRPESLNAITWEMVEELHDCYSAFEDDLDLRVVILTGAGRGFCSGTDLKAGRDDQDEDQSPDISGLMRRQRRIADLSIHMRQIPQPNIAAVTGVAAGGVGAVRPEVGRRMRGRGTIDATREDPLERIAEITDGRMADLAIEMVGHNFETINTCIDAVKRLGTVLGFGVPDDDVYPIDYSKIIRKNIQVLGSIGPEAQADFPLAMNWIAEGRIDVSPILTSRLPFTEVQKGFELFVGERDKAIKVVLEY